jgi:hypothetical protein
MPFVGIGLHIVIALFFAVHAIKTGRQMYWLLILFSFPLLGSVVYFFAEYLPSSKMERSVKKVSSVAMQLLDPTRELREAKDAFELSPSVQNRMRLAAALDSAGEYQQAVEQFDACLNGPFAKDPEVRFGAAKAKFHVNNFDQAIALLLDLQATDKSFKPEQVTLLLAQSYAKINETEKAREAFLTAANTFGSAESRIYYAIWSAEQGDVATAKAIKADLDKDWARWNKHSRQLHKPLYDALNAALNNQ